VYLPILLVKDTISAPLPPPKDILERLMTPPEMWALPLWHCIRPHAPVDAILYHLQQQQHLIICSDAGVDSAKYSSCAWTIYGSEVLWQGKGIVPGNHDDMYSGRSEAFGILTALMFLSHYLHHYPHPIEPQCHSLLVYCDNSGVVTQATKYSKATIIYPTLTTTNDYDVFREITHVVQTLHQFSITFLHVKGHQDQHKKPHLVLPACLNIECDQ